MTDNTELKRLAEACVAAGEYLPGEAWEEDRSYCQAEVAFLEFAPVGTPAAVLALITERDQLKAENEALVAAAQALRDEWRKDQACAERYRWLKSRPVNAPTSGPDLAQWDDHQGDALRGPFADEAIDAAMAKGERS